MMFTLSDIGILAALIAVATGAQMAFFNVKYAPRERMIQIEADMKYIRLTLDRVWKKLDIGEPE